MDWTDLIDIRDGVMYMHWSIRLVGLIVSIVALVWMSMTWARAFQEDDRDGP